MKTDKFISNISYNTPIFLKSRLDSLMQKKILAFYAFIWHKGEIDKYEPDKREKDHIHLLLKPRNPIETDTLTDFFNEFIEGETLPVGVLPFWDKSKPGPWIMYGAHFKPYLDTLPETKEFYNYKWSDFYTSDYETFCRYRSQVKLNYKANYSSVKSLVEQGSTLNQIFDSVNPSAIQTKAVADTINQVMQTLNREFVQVDKKTGETVAVDVAISK